MGIADFFGFSTAKSDAATAAEGNAINANVDNSNSVLGNMGKIAATQQANSQSNLGNMQTARGGIDTSAAAEDGREANATEATQSNFQQKTDALRGQAADQAANAQKTYSQSVAPAQIGQMEKAQEQAGQSMSLAQYGNVNNAVQQQTRNLYGDQGAAQVQANAQMQSQYGPNYGAQISGTQHQGTSDYGVLAALGAQATKGSMGGGNPLTGGQMQALQGSNQQAASGAYNNAMQRVNGLQDQRNQMQQNLANTQMSTSNSYRSGGLDQAATNNSQVYGSGVQANANAIAATNNAQLGANTNATIQSGLDSGINNLDSQVQKSQTATNNAYATANRDVLNRAYGNVATDYNAQQGIYNQATNAQQGIQLGALSQGNSTLAQQMAMYGGVQQSESAQNAARTGVLSSVISGGAGVAGSVFQGAYNGGGGTKPGGTNNTTPTGSTDSSATTAGDPGAQGPSDPGGAGAAGFGNSGQTVAVAHGGIIPGRAQVPGDSLANDTVAAKLSPGELVIPRSVVAKGPVAIQMFAKNQQKSA